MPERPIANMNMASATILRGRAEFVLVGNRRLRLRLRKGLRKPNRSPMLDTALTQARNWFRNRTVSRLVGIGGTDEQTLCQLILWWRDLPRLPARVLVRWQNDNSDFATTLENIGYDDDKSTRCVLCGAPHKGLDWWSLNGVTGPCCSFGMCPKRQRT